MGTSSTGRFCPRCGTTNPPDYNFCANCHLPLPGGPPAPAAIAWTNSGPGEPMPLPGSSTPSENVLEIGQGAAGVVFIWIGIPLLLIGMGLLVGAAVAHQGAQSFDQACSANPLCTTSAPDPSGALTAVGVIVLILAIGLVAFGIKQYSERAR